MISDRRRRKLRNQRDHLQREFERGLAERTRLLVAIDMVKSERLRAGARCDLFVLTQTLGGFQQRFAQLDKELPTARHWQRDDDVEEAVA